MDDVVLPPWIPEDDLLLKNAVEAGASLESLAKGAVQFSRKYSITELRDRWRSLLYDPDVSAEASVSMANLELSGKSAGSGVVKEGTIGDGYNGVGVGVMVTKRKRGPSIRKQYYAMRKRLCRQVFHSLDSLDGAVHVEMDLVKIKQEGEVESGGICSLDNGNNNNNNNNNNNKDMSNNNNNNSVGCGSYSGMEDVVLSQSMSDIALWRTIEDVAAPAMPVEECAGRNDGDGEEARATKPSPPHGLKNNSTGDVSNAFAAMPGDLPLNLSTGNEPCYENVDSLLLSSPCEIPGNDATDICESRKVDVVIKASDMPSSSSAAGLVVVAKPLDCSLGDVPSDCDPCNKDELSVSVQTPHREPSEECKLCLLNAEDADVPSEDSADSCIVVPCLLTRKRQPNVKEEGYTDSSVNNQIKKEPDRSLKKENTSHSSASSKGKIVKPVLASNINSSQPPVSVVTRAENLGRNPISAVPSQSNSIISASHNRLVHATIFKATDEHPKQKESVSSASAKHHANSRAGQQKDLPESEVKSMSLYQERENDDDDDDNDDEDDSDNEVPSFSDAEAMILEMDLSPTDQDTSASREVLRYQHPETKRTIMRLEQSARSFMQRAIASRGAFAVLYGRNLKQYINKSEVILGRGTDDLHVDIDLRREGCANKISRRQALIKMEANGSFIIKNLGKNSIFLNGKEVAPGQLRGLSTSSLIEIRGLSFIFETNNKSVKSYLENMNIKGEDKGKALTMVA